MTIDPKNIIKNMLCRQKATGYWDGNMKNNTQLARAVRDSYETKMLDIGNFVSYDVVSSKIGKTR
jgi:hypothetical protein